MDSPTPTTCAGGCAGWDTFEGLGGSWVVGRGSRVLATLETRSLTISNLACDPHAPRGENE